MSAAALIAAAAMAFLGAIIEHLDWPRTFGLGLLGIGAALTAYSAGVRAPYWLLPLSTTIYIILCRFWGVSAASIAAYGVLLLAHPLHPTAILGVSASWLLGAWFGFGELAAGFVVVGPVAEAALLQGTIGGRVTAFAIALAAVAQPYYGVNPIWRLYGILSVSLKAMAGRGSVLALAVAVDYALRLALVFATSLSIG